MAWRISPGGVGQDQPDAGRWWPPVAFGEVPTSRYFNLGI